jgi:hypothetical protein
VEFPTADGGTGHLYEVLADTAATYDDAVAAADALGGHLVSITSAAEQAFVEDLLVDSGSYWIGLERIGPGADFGWTTGESLMFDNFATGEPNDYTASEDFGQIYWSADAADDNGRSGKWNDAIRAGYPDGEITGEPTPDLERSGFIIELPDVGNPPATPIPLPPALLAAPLGLGLAAWAGRRARRVH